MRCITLLILFQLQYAIICALQIAKFSKKKNGKVIQQVCEIIFYGVKVQLLTTKDGIPIAFHFTPGKTGDAKAIGKMIDKLPAEASLYSDSAYTDYGLEDIALERKCVLLKIQRKSNAKRIDTLEQKKEKLKMRKRVETTISDIKKMFPRTIHAITLEGLLMKLTLFDFGLQLNKSIK